MSMQQAKSSKYKAYPEYKDSGIEWLGEIPAHWTIPSAKHLVRVQGGYAFQSDSFGDVGIPVIRIGDIKTNETVQLETCKKVDLEANNFRSYIAKKGDLLVAMTGATIGKIGVVRSSKPALLNQRVGCFKNDEKKINNDFLRYIVTSDFYGEHVKLSSDGGAQPNISDQGLTAINFPIATIHEQTQIAAFLDHETAKIDALIEKQQQLIELLKEKRQAVISHAVTKGLDPDVPMKDSGVEWLGEIPAHWITRKFSQSITIRNGQVDPRVQPYRDFVLVAPNHIESQTGKIISKETALEQGADSGKYECMEGEVLYSKIRPSLAKACISPSDSTLCSADMYPLDGGTILNNQYLLWLVLSKWFTTLTVLESDRVAMPKINREKLADFRLPVPQTKNEQIEIAKHVKVEVEKIDQLIALQNDASQLMRERRSALISAAVTGKIDVRDWKEPA